jgi:uncharacterized membrane protein YfcA
MGGGSLMTPILVIIFGFKPTVARRTSAKTLPAAGITTPITLRPDA